MCVHVCICVWRLHRKPLRGVRVCAFGAKWCDHLWQMMILKVLRAAGVGIYAMNVCNIPTICTNTRTHARAHFTLELAYFHACNARICSSSSERHIQLVAFTLTLHRYSIEQKPILGNGSYRKLHFIHSARPSMNSVFESVPSTSLSISEKEDGGGRLSHVCKNTSFLPCRADICNIHK